MNSVDLAVGGPRHGGDQLAVLVDDPQAGVAQLNSITLSHAIVRMP